MSRQREALCAGCPVRDECLVTALVVEDAAAIRGGLTREARAALFVAIEQDAFGLDDWLRERAQQLRAGVVMLATVGQDHRRHGQGAGGGGRGVCTSAAAAGHRP